MITAGANCNWRASDFRFSRTMSDGLPLLPSKNKKSWLQIGLLSIFGLIAFDLLLYIAYCCW